MSYYAENMSYYADVISMMVENYEKYNGSYNNLLQSCPSVITNETFRMQLLFPAIAFTLILVVYNKKTGNEFNFLFGKPGYLFPLDIFKRSHRFFFAATYGTLAHLCTNIMVESTYAFKYYGPDYLNGLIALISMLIYGIGYLPIILGISLECPLGYLSATLFSWIYTIEFFINSFCRQENVVSYFLLFMSVLPEIVCYISLSVGLPFQLGISIHKRSKCRSQMLLDIPEKYICYESMKKSFQWTYVKNLLRKPQAIPPTNKYFHQKAIEMLKSLMQCVVYVPSNDFRLSARMVSVVTVGLIITYKITFTVIINIYNLMRFLQNTIVYQFAQISVDSQPTDTDDLLALRKFLFTAYKFVITFKGQKKSYVIVQRVIPKTSYFKRGNVKPQANEDHYPLSWYEIFSQCGSIRYAGYQVGHIGGGFTIQCFMTIINSLAVALFAALWEYFGTYLLDKLLDILIILCTAIIVFVIQFILSKFIFLQEKGNVLVIEKRRLFFIFTYFMFFYYIFIAIFHSILRILASVILGTFSLPRLDYSVLPRKFQIIDLGFFAYCGFLHLESSHTNPIAMVFISILQAENQRSRTDKIYSKKETGTYIEWGSTMDRQKINNKRRKARWHWNLAFTLVNNPRLSNFRIKK